MVIFNPIVKGLAAIFAVVLLGGSGAHHAMAPMNQRPVASFAESTDRQDDPLIRGRGNTAFPVPPPPPPPAAAVAPLPNQPISALPIAANPVPAPAAPAVTIGSIQQAMINQDRAAAGLGALSWNSCLAGIAYQNAVRMANQGSISHAGGAQASLGCGLGSRTGENIGQWSGGVNDGGLNAMFMSSPGHLENIMGPFHHVATAWVVAPNGQAYLAVEFG